jgi:acyl carrier protein
MNPPESFEVVVRDILGDVLNQSSENLDANTVLAARGWNSLASLEALAQFEAQLNIRLDLRSFHAAHTVAQMIQLVGESVANRP